METTAPQKQHSTIKTFPCTSCGARLSFSPGTQHLKCEFCGAANDIAKDDSAIEEEDFETFLKSLEDRQETFESVAVKCGSCGAAQEMAANTFAGRCNFCATPIVSKGYAQRHIKPKSLIPFQVGKPEALVAFRSWINGLWLAPSDLKKYAKGDGGIHGVYLPYWTYDCNTYSEYSGQRGRDYTVAVEGANNTTRMETRTEWTPVSGSVTNAFDDVLVPASPTMKKLSYFDGGDFEHFDTKTLVPYSEEFVSGFVAEAYQVGLADGYVVAKGIIDDRIKQSICLDIGGDRQQVNSVSTQYSDTTFKHVLVPVWISAYRYRDKVYRFMINGQSGAVQGESPKSAWKIFFLVLAALAVLVVWEMLGEW